MSEKASAKSPGISLCASQTRTKKFKKWENWRQNRIFRRKTEKIWNLKRNFMCTYTFYIEHFLESFMYEHQSHFLHPKKIVLKLNLVFMLSASSLLPLLSLLTLPLPLLLLFPLLFFKNRIGELPSFENPNFKLFIYSTFTWMKMLPLPIYKMDYMNTHIHTNIYAARFSYVFFRCRRCRCYVPFFFLLPFFRSKTQIDIGWRRAA